MHWKYVFGDRHFVRWFVCIYCVIYLLIHDQILCTAWGLFFSLHRKFKMLGKTTIFIPYQHFPTVIKYFKINTDSCQFFFCPIVLIKWPAFLRFICFMQVLMTSIFQSLRFVYAFESVSYTICWRLISFDALNNSYLIDKYSLL